AVGLDRRRLAGALGAAAALRARVVVGVVADRFGGHRAVELLRAGAGHARARQAGAGVPDVRAARRELAGVGAVAEEAVVARRAVGLGRLAVRRAAAGGGPVHGGAVVAQLARLEDVVAADRRRLARGDGGIHRDDGRRRHGSRDGRLAALQAEIVSPDGVYGAGHRDRVARAQQDDSDGRIVLIIQEPAERQQAALRRYLDGARTQRHRAGVRVDGARAHVDGSGDPDRAAARGQVDVAADAGRRRVDGPQHDVAERLDVERSARSVGPGRVERDLVPRLLRDRRAGLDREAAARAAGATVERHGIVDGDREARAHVELAAVAAILVRAAAAVPGDRAVQRDVAVARVDLDLAAVPVGVAAVRIDLAYGHGPQGRRDRDAAAVGRRADVEHAGDERARAGGDVDLAAERERSRGTCQEIRAHRDESAGLELDGAARRIHSGALDVDPAGER